MKSEKLPSGMAFPHSLRVVFPSLRMAFPHSLRDGVPSPDLSQRERDVGDPSPLGGGGERANAAQPNLSQSSILNSQFSILNSINSKNISKMKKKEIIKYGIQLLIAILTAIGTSLGVTSCMSLL